MGNGLKYRVRRLKDAPGQAYGGLAFTCNCGSFLNMTDPVARKFAGQVTREMGYATHEVWRRSCKHIRLVIYGRNAVAAHAEAGDRARLTLLRDAHLAA